MMDWLFSRSFITNYNIIWRCCSSNTMPKATIPRRFLIAPKFLALIIVIIWTRDGRNSFCWSNLIQLWFHLSSSLLLFYLFLSFPSFLSLANFSTEKVYKRSYFTLSRSRTKFFVIIHLMSFWTFLWFISLLALWF